MNSTHLPPRQAAVLFCLAALLSACALTSNGLSDPTATPAATLPPATAAQQPTLTASPVPSAPAFTPTPASLAIAFVGQVAGAPAGSVAALSLQSAQAAAAAHSARLTIIDARGLDPAAALHQAAQSGAVLVVAAGESLTEATQSVAHDFPAIKFIGVDQAPANLPNYVSLGGPENRLDEEGFLAGLLAGLLTQQRKVGVVTLANSLAGKLYQTGFLHGLRYTCGDCVLIPVEIEDPNEAGKGERIADGFKNGQIDVMFAAAGAAGEQAIEAANAQGLMTIGLGRDLPPGPLTLSSILRRPDRVLPDLIGQLLAGQPAASAPFSLANGSLSYGDGFGPAISPAVVNYLKDVLPQLASGALDTGVDLATGAEK